MSSLAVTSTSTDHRQHEYRREKKQSSPHCHTYLHPNHPVGFLISELLTVAPLSSSKTIWEM